MVSFGKDALPTGLTSVRAAEHKESASVCWPKMRFQHVADCVKLLLVNNMVAVVDMCRLKLACVCIYEQVSDFEYGLVYRVQIHQWIRFSEYCRRAHLRYFELTEQVGDLVCDCTDLIELNHSSRAMRICFRQVNLAEHAYGHQSQSQPRRSKRGFPVSGNLCIEQSLYLVSGAWLCLGKFDVED